MGKYRPHPLTDPNILGRQAQDMRDLRRQLREERAARRLPSSSMAHAFRYAGAQSIPSDAWTQVSSWLDTATADPVAEAAVTITDGGPYFVGAQLAYVPNGTGRRGVRILKNGDTAEPIAYAALNADTGGGNSTFLACFALHRLAEGDVLSVDAYQTSGAALDLLVGRSRSNLSIYRVSV